jgi:hypothetical protein
MMSRSVTLLGILLSAAACLAAPGPAQAQSPAPVDRPGGANYRMDSDAWDGLSRLASMLDSLGMPWSQVDSVSLPDLPARSVLVLLYPTSELPLDAIIEHIETGGNILLADDFGSAGPLLARVGLHREVPVGAGQPATPESALLRATAVGHHPLSDSARTLLTNHPSALWGLDGAAFRFDARLAAVSDMSIGAGRVVVLSDPSILTNLMLERADNLAFARSAVRLLCDNRPGCRIVVASDGARITGGGAAVKARALAERFRDANGILRAAQAEGLPASVLAWLALLLFATALSTLFRFFPRNQP